MRDGFRALNRGLEGFCLDSPEWHLAFHNFSRAKLERTVDRVKLRARRSPFSRA